MKYKVDSDDLVKYGRLVFLTNGYKNRFLFSFNFDYLNQFVANSIELNKWSDYIINKYNLPKGKEYKIDLINECVEEKDAKT